MRQSPHRIPRAGLELRRVERIATHPQLVDTCLRHLLLMSVFGVSIVGCSLTTPIDGTDGSKGANTTDRVVAATSADVWAALAQAVQSKAIISASRLAQYVVVLSRNGELTDKDVAAFDAAFPKIAIDSRDLSDLDVKTLNELGRKAKQ